LKTFGLIGVGGYIAPRHLQAIKETGNDLLASLDKHDSVGILDRYFPNSKFFTEFERFDRHLEKIKHQGNGIDYVSICSPNYLHDAHCRFALRIGADAICEKPLVLNPWNVDALEEIEKDTGRRIHCILQLRLHPAMIALKEKINNDTSDKKYDIDLTYITSRGPWYDISWKGDISKSGGVANNIGIHFFDMLTWIFGAVINNTIHYNHAKKIGGCLELQNGIVRWFLSLDRDDLPEKPESDKPATYRSINVNGKEIDFSGGFTDLHTQSYQQILAGNGFGLSEVRTAVEIVSDIRDATPVGLVGDYHPFLDNILK